MPTIDEITLPDGTTRRLGNIPAAPSADAPRFAAGPNPKAVLIPRSEWKGLIDAAGGPGVPTVADVLYMTYVHDQNGIGMCNASATVSAMENQRLKQGLPPRKMSAGSLYRLISGGADNGSTLEDGIRAAQSAGVASTQTVPYLDWRQPRQGESEDRARNKVLEAYLCPTFDHCVSAVLQGYDLISGIWWYDNYTPDRDGWLPRPGGNRGGHAVHGVRATYRNGEYGIWHKNSWTPQWGVGGFVVFPESVYQSHDIGGWWAVRQVTDEGNVIPIPPTEGT